MWTRRQFVSAGAAAAAIGSSACARRKTSQPDAYVFVANSDGRSIAVADLATFAVARQIPLDSEPSQVIAPASAPAVYALTPVGGSVHEIAVEQLKVQRKLRLGRLAVSMRLSLDGKSLYVLLAQPRKLVRIALDRFAVDWERNLPLSAIDFDLASFFDPSLKRERLTGAVSFGAAGSFALFEPGGNGPVGNPIVLGGEAGAVRFQYGRELIVANLSERLLSIYQTVSGKRIVELPLKNRPDHLCFSPDAGQLFVTGQGADTVSVVFPYQIPEVAETILAGRTPGAMAVSTDPAYLFIANPSSGDVSILNVRDRKIMAVVSVGAEPGFITTTPNSTFALVLNRKSGDMAVLRIGTITRNWRKSASLFTMIPVGSGPVSAAVRMI
jgi:DNA-binding beta-propeller fold protein YncE